jgi:hypothetical protein
MALLFVLHGSRGGGGTSTRTTIAGSSPTTTLANAAGSSGGAEAVLLRLTAGADTAAVVALTASGEPAMILGMPGNTLLMGSGGFKSLHELLTQGKFDMAAAALGTLLGVKVTALATLPWASLSPLRLSGAADATVSSSTAVSPTQAPLAAAQAVAALCGSLGTAEGRQALAGLPFEGEKDRVTAALASLSKSDKVVAALPGKLVEGTDYTYYEPDAEKTRALFGGKTAQKAFKVEVQNGSGVLGIAQAVGDVIAAKGYTMLPAKNAAKFPNVAGTEVYASADSLGEAERIRALLGKGKVVRQDALPAGKIVVIVGKDMSMSDVPKVGS